MKKSIVIILLCSLFLGCNKNLNRMETVQFRQNIYIKDANSRITYFEVHKIYEARKYCKGKNVKIGIIDHSFDGKNNPGLYSEIKKFYNEDEKKYSIIEAGHGFWMASTLKEIAPEVEIYGLDIDYADKTEDEIISPMIQAIEWAIDKNLKILTYSAGRISEKNRAKLDLIIDEANENGIIIIFLHNPNENNFLVSKIEPPIDGIDNSPIVNIYDRDYSVILGDMIDKNGKVDSNRVFTSVSSKPPVLAGIVAMMLEIDPMLNNEEIRTILMKTSYIFENYDTRIENAVNAKEAIEECIRIKEENGV